MRLSPPKPDTVLSVTIFLLVWITHLLSPNATPFDSRWTLYTAQNLLDHGTPQLDRYLPLLARDHFYAIECVTPTHHRIYPITAATDCPAGGHLYNFYPVAVSVLAAPLLFATETALHLAKPILRPLALHFPPGPRRAFLQADLLSGSPMLTELFLASFLIALAAVAIYGIGRRFLSPPRAATLALLFAFCTPAWSTGSRALWQHTPDMLLLALALLLAVHSARHPRLLHFLGVPLILAFYVRPTSAVPLLCFTAFIALHHRRALGPFFAWMLPVILFFTALSWTTYGTLLAPYALIHRANAPGLALRPQMFTALYGNLLSPGRGLFVFVPLFLVSVAGMCIHRPADPTARALRPWLLAAVLLHWLLISSFDDWSAGHAFGPRYFSDLTPFFVYFLIPTVAALRLHPPRRLFHAITFTALAALSFFIHFRGATRWATMEWNTLPIEIHSDPGRLWRWTDLQFFRGLH